MMGALARYVSSCDRKVFQPINSNWGIIDPLPQAIRDKRERHLLQAEQGMRDLKALTQPTWV
jgi:methylenetetrahydrofolate--tRNA-(uracil-5-)-methyltransferase